MAYNTKAIVKDVDGNPISQYYNEVLDAYEPVVGVNGANTVVPYNSDNTPTDLDLIPLITKLEEMKVALNNRIIDYYPERLAQVEEDLEIAKVHKGLTPPTDNAMFWLDIN